MRSHSAVVSANRRVLFKIARKAVKGWRNGSSSKA